MRDYTRLEQFLNSLTGDIYPEAPMEPHISITKMMINALLERGVVGPGVQVLDIGCGQGGALELFRALGAEAIGVTLGTDAAICRAKGFEIRCDDQSFLSFGDQEFDLLWCRHVLEHSVAPLFTLSEYRRVVKPGGFVYVETPAPDTSAHHERNPNHYSVLPRSAWMELFRRTDFVLENHKTLNFEVPCGPDQYWAFLLRSDRTFRRSATGISTTGSA